MEHTLTYLPGVRLVNVCAPACATRPEDILTITLTNDLLADLGARPGYLAVISRREQPVYGEAGAVRYDGGYLVGYLFFTTGGGVAVADSKWVKTLKEFVEGEYEVIGRVDRICPSCALGGCTPVLKSKGQAIENPVALAN
jgi:hypothetical protein